MQSLHFIAVLIAFYERAYSERETASSPLLELAVQAADQVATNDWHEQGARAGAVGAALVRTLHGEGAADAASGLSAALQLQIAGEDPEPR